MTNERESETAALQKITACFRELMADRFFGEVAVSFQNGKPHTVKVHRTYKIEQL